LPKKKINQERQNENPRTFNHTRKRTNGQNGEEVLLALSWRYEGAPMRGRWWWWCMDDTRQTDKDRGVNSASVIGKVGHRVERRSKFSGFQRELVRRT